MAKKKDVIEENKEKIEIKEMKENKAKDAFNEYKKKMSIHPDTMTMTGVPKSPEHFSSPYSHTIPPPLHSYDPHYMPQMSHESHPYSAAHHPHLSSPGSSCGCEGSVFGNIGTMLKLGVNFINSALIGGTQIMKEFSSGGSDCSCSKNQCEEDECYDEGCGCESNYTENCGCNSSCNCNSSCSCNPSVNGCGC